jgi:deoxyribodipyrimidine photo-lyase
MLIKQRRVLYWFTRDLRIHDNQALHAIKSADRLLCIYVVDPRWFQQKLWQQPSISKHRWQFTLECIQGLKQNLARYDQELIVLYGDTTELISNLINNYGFSDLVLTQSSGSYERHILKAIRRKCSEAAVIEYEQYTIFNELELPFKVSQLPQTYSRFRKSIENQGVPDPLPAPKFLPIMPKIDMLEAEKIPDWLPVNTTSLRFTGGEREAFGHLFEYFSSDAPRRYKTVRNELSGWTNSSKISPWLSSGCLSPRQVIKKLLEYEQENGSNDSSRWLYVELLWREYFQWWHFLKGDQLFSFQGSKKSPPLTSFYPERFSKWCEGETPFKIVNACMKELKNTGYLSNRGRQIAASCLVNELSVDWRYGAAWFEYCLIDFDLAVNWGNWQYIAGVGVDPRGGRHFDLEKQSRLYDPDGLYQKRWGAETDPNLDSRDAADWPIIHE